MDARDLRVGNKVQDNNGFIFDVVSIFKDGTVYCDFEGNQGDVWEFDKNNPCVGIELTEEILLKCGFEKDDTGVDIYDQDYHEWYQKELPIIGVLYQNSTKDYLFDENTETLRIYYLHQLQNLYFALTGEELNITL